VKYTKEFDSFGTANIGLCCPASAFLGNMIDFADEKSKFAAKVGIRLSEWFTAELGNRQGDSVSPLSFISLLERVMKATECMNLQPIKSTYID